MEGYLITPVVRVRVPQVFFLKNSYLDKHSYLDRRLDLRVLPWVGARGQNRGHLYFFLLFNYGNNFDRYLVRHRSTLWHWLLDHEVKVSMTYFSRSSDFALYLEDFSRSSESALFLKHFILSDYEAVWPEVWPQNNVGHSNLYFTVQ